MSSFVRQLNMYDFHKVKGQKYHHEFAHPFFKRDDEENLKLIRRKHVKKIHKLKLDAKWTKISNLRSKVLKSKLAKMKEILELVIQQNHSLLSLNNRMMDELTSLKDIWASKSKDLLGLAIQLILKPDSSLINQYKAYLYHRGFIRDSVDSMTLSDILLFFKGLEEPSSQNNLSIYKILDDLIILKKKEENGSTFENLYNSVASEKIIHEEGPASYNYTIGITSPLCDHLYTYSNNAMINHCDPLGQISSLSLSNSNLIGDDQIPDRLCYRTIEDTQFEEFINDALDSVALNEEIILMTENKEHLSLNN